MPLRGEVWWIETPHAGRRPGAVLTRSEAIPALPVVLVALATTNHRGLVSEVSLDAEDGMPRPCVLNLDTPELVPKALLVERITTLSEVRMHQACEALAAATACRHVASG